MKLGRPGDGAWVGRARRLRQRITELEPAHGDAAFEAAVAEAGLTPVAGRRYLEAYRGLAFDPYGTEPPDDDVRISLNACEHLRTLQKVDVALAEAWWTKALAGEIPLPDIQDAIRDARVRGAATGLQRADPVDVIVARFHAAGVKFPLHRVSVPPEGSRHLKASADATQMGLSDENVPVLEREWVLVLSPGIRGAPLEGASFQEFLHKVAAATAWYRHVSAYCSSPYERGELERCSKDWRYSGEDRLSVLLSGA